MGARSDDAPKNDENDRSKSSDSEAFCRTNGWTWPLHPLQLLAWIVLVYLAVFFICATIPALIPAIQYACYTVSSECY
jgi:hypothetical protein